LCRNAWSRCLDTASSSAIRTFSAGGAVNYAPPAGQPALRERWKAYKARGLELNKYDM